MLLGAAKLLKEVEATIPGTVRLVFQPNEEFGAGGNEIIQLGSCGCREIIQCTVRKTHITTNDKLFPLRWCAACIMEPRAAQQQLWLHDVLKTT
jgi:hypothetical protein